MKDSLIQYFHYVHSGMEHTSKIRLLCHDITVEPEGPSYNHVNLLTFMKLSAAKKSVYHVFIPFCQVFCVIHRLNPHL